MIVDITGATSRGVRAEYSPITECINSDNGLNLLSNCSISNKFRFIESLDGEWITYYNRDNSTLAELGWNFFSEDPEVLQVQYTGKKVSLLGAENTICSFLRSVVANKLVSDKELGKLQDRINKTFPESTGNVSPGRISRR